MAKKIKDKERDSIDFGKSRIDPLFNSIFYPTLLSMVFASFFTVADGIFVGQGVGSNALAAINIVSPLFLITTGIALMFGVGVSLWEAVMHYCHYVRLIFSPFFPAASASSSR